MAREHSYKATITWTGNLGEGTPDYRSYGRSHRIEIEGKPALEGSADAAFLGDPQLHNPEDLLLAAVSTCHMLWYLHLCSDAGISVLAYRDSVRGTMTQDADGGGRFTSLSLHPEVTIAPGGDAAKAEALHGPASAKCFIANSLNLPVDHKATITVGEEPV
ncbi:MAG: OsmC family protein [Kiloniellales bacterium]